MQLVIDEAFLPARLTAPPMTDEEFATGPSAGSVLPNCARRSPDAAWTAKGRVLALDPKSLEGFWHLGPDFVIELRSKTDRLPVLRRKMQELDRQRRAARVAD